MMLISGVAGEVPQATNQIGAPGCTILWQKRLDMRSRAQDISQQHHLFSLFSLTIMAIARPIRVLGLTAIALWCFFLYQIFGPVKETDYTGRPDLERDPNLDSALSSSPTPYTLSNTFHSNGRARRHITQGG